MDRLKQLQNYYTYAAHAWEYKQPPRLDNELRREIERLGFRLTWGGTALVRPQPNEIDALVRGSLEATKYLPNGRLALRWEKGKRKNPVAWVFNDPETGKERRVQRTEDIPKGVLCWDEWEYVDFGELRWFLEKRLTPEQAIQAGIHTERSIVAEAEHYPFDHPNNPARHVFFPLPNGMLQTAAGQYYEPDRQIVEMCRASVWEMNNEDTAALARRDMEIIAQQRQDAEAKQAEAEDRECDAWTEGVLEHIQRARTFSLPAR